MSGDGAGVVASAATAGGGPLPSSDSRTVAKGSQITTGSSNPQGGSGVGIRTTPGEVAVDIEHRPQLKRVLSLPLLISAGVGTTIGAGIFVVTGYVAHEKTGPGLILSYLVSGVCCLLAALCYAEFASSVPRAGSAYAYAKEAFGEALGFMMGWDLVLEYAVAGASVARGWSEHFIELLRELGATIPNDCGIVSPPFRKNYQTGEYERSGNIIDVPAVLVSLLLTVIAVKGIRESMWLTFVMVVIKVFIVVFVVCAGLAFVSRANLDPFLPFGFFSLSFFGQPVAGQKAADGSAAGVVAGAAVVFFSYIGFDSVTTQAEECRDPQRDLPWAIFGSLAITTALYMLVSFVLVGMVPYTEIDTAAPITTAFSRHGQSWMAIIVAIGAIAGLTSVLLAQFVGQPRILMAMGRDGLLPRFFADVHPEHGTPWKGTILTGVLVALASGLIPIEILVDLVSIGTLLAFFLVCIGVLSLRYCIPGYDATGEAHMQIPAGEPEAFHQSVEYRDGEVQRRIRPDNELPESIPMEELGRSSRRLPPAAQERQVPDQSAVAREEEARLEQVAASGLTPSLPLTERLPHEIVPVVDVEELDEISRGVEAVPAAPDAAHPPQPILRVHDLPHGVAVRRKFRVPCVPFIPGLGALVCLILMFSLPWQNWLRLVVWWAVGLLVYFLWSRRNAAALRALSFPPEGSPRGDGDSLASAGPSSPSKAAARSSNVSTAAPGHAHRSSAPGTTEPSSPSQNRRRKAGGTQDSSSAYLEEEKEGRAALDENKTRLLTTPDSTTEEGSLDYVPDQTFSPFSSRSLLRGGLGRYGTLQEEVDDDYDLIHRPKLQHTEENEDEETDAYPRLSLSRVSLKDELLGIPGQEAAKRQVRFTTSTTNAPPPVNVSGRKIGLGPREVGEEDESVYH